MDGAPVPYEPSAMSYYLRLVLLYQSYEVVVVCTYIQHTYGNSDWGGGTWMLDASC